MIIIDITDQKTQRHDIPLNQFRAHSSECMTRRDALFELADAIAATPARVSDIARLSLEPEQERGHGGIYDGLAACSINHDLQDQTLTSPVTFIVKQLPGSSPRRRPRP